MLISPPIPPEKSVSTRKLSSSWQQTQVFQNSNFTWKLVFYHCQQSVIFQSDVTDHFIFKRISAKYSSLNNNGMSLIILLRKIDVLWEKSSSQLNYTSSFSQCNHQYFDTQQKHSVHTSHFVTKNILKVCTQ